MIFILWDRKRYEWPKYYQHYWNVRSQRSRGPTRETWCAVCVRWSRGRVAGQLRESYLAAGLYYTEIHVVASIFTISDSVTKVTFLVESISTVGLMGCKWASRAKHIRRRLNTCSKLSAFGSLGFSWSCALVSRLFVLSACTNNVRPFGCILRCYIAWTWQLN